MEAHPQSTGVFSDSGCPGSFLQCLGSLLGVYTSLVVALGLRCPKACGILVPQPGMEPTSPAPEGRFLTTEPPGKSQHQWLLMLPRGAYHRLRATVVDCGASINHISWLSMPCVVPPQKGFGSGLCWPHGIGYEKRFWKTSGTIQVTVT